MNTYTQHTLMNA